MHAPEADGSQRGDALQVDQALERWIERSMQRLRQRATPGDVASVIKVTWAECTQSSSL